MTTATTTNPIPTDMLDRIRTACNEFATRLRYYEGHPIDLLDPYIWYALQRVYALQTTDIQRSIWFRHLLRHATAADLDALNALVDGASGIHAYMFRSLQTSLLKCAYQRDQAHKSVSVAIPVWFRDHGDWGTVVPVNWYCEVRAANKAFLAQQDAVVSAHTVQPTTQTPTQPSPTPTPQTPSPLASPIFVTYEGDPKRLNDPRYERSELLRRIVDGTMSGWETHANGQDLRDIYYLMRGRPERVGAKTTPGYTNKADLLAAILAMKNLIPSGPPAII